MGSATNRYAVSLYADLRCGVINGRIYSKEDAYEVVSHTYGEDAANYAQTHCG